MDEEFISRTADGLLAESLLRDVKIIFHIEGKGHADDVEKLSDYIFYDGILSELLDCEYEIKVEGGKNNLLLSLEVLKSNNDNNAGDNNAGDNISETHKVFMDRDHDDFIGINQTVYDFVFYTFGYSFENDFWNSGIIRRISSSFCYDASKVDDFIISWKKLEKKISFFHKMNLISRCNGSDKQLFRLKGFCGLMFEYKGSGFEFSRESRECVDRYKRAWLSSGVRYSRETTAARQRLKAGFFAHHGYLIQGHAYESSILEAINQFYLYQQVLSLKGNHTNLFRNMAYGEFKSSPKRYLPQTVLDYYSTILQPFNGP